MNHKPKPCRYCKAGSVAKDDGCHWIVKSIFPARIDIRRCAALPKEEKVGVTSALIEHEREGAR